MREYLKRPLAAWLRAGWFWVSIVLVLPSCGFDSSGLGGGSSPNLDKGPEPHNDLIFCDIPRVEGRHCATAADLATGIRLAEAAVALNEGRTGVIGLDDSPTALANCGGDTPEAVVFEGAFPEGFPVCLNCAGAIGTPATPDVTSACRKRCYDFVGPMDDVGSVFPENPPSAATVAFCDAVAKPATNFPLDTCFMGVCDNGTVLITFTDPRRTPEPVVWADLIGVDTGGADGNDLVRTTGTTDTWASGAVSASTQWIKGGDAFVEFSANQTNLSIIVGFTELPAACAEPCPDVNPSWEPMNFATFFRLDSRFTFTESGTILAGPDVDGSFGTYFAGERFRVRLRDTGNGTASVRFTRLIGACTPGTLCNEQEIHAPAGLISYPMRVDASFFQPGATLTDARLVRIR